jgi:hypothetical protein
MAENNPAAAGMLLLSAIAFPWPPEQAVTAANVATATPIAAIRRMEGPFLKPVPAAGGMPQPARSLIW